MSVNTSRRLAKWLALLFLGSLLLLFRHGACAATCGESVQIGDTGEDVLRKCGPSTLQEKRQVTVEEVGGGTTRKTVTEIVDWTYDRGPDELVLTFRFQDGKVAEVSVHGYGRARDFSVDTCHNGEALAVGDTTVQAYLKCGAPLAKEKLSDRVEVTESEGVKRRTSLSVEEWTYRYGRDLPGYTLTFENGTAVGVRPRAFGS